MENYIGKRLSQARKANNLTQEQFSELTGISVSEISRIETGRNSTTIDTLLKFSEVLKIGLDDLLYDYFLKAPQLRILISSRWFLLWRLWTPDTRIISQKWLPSTRTITKNNILFICIFMANCPLNTFK